MQTVGHDITIALETDTAHFLPVLLHLIVVEVPEGNGRVVFGHHVYLFVGVHDVDHPSSDLHPHEVPLVAEVAEHNEPGQPQNSPHSRANRPDHVGEVAIGVAGASGFAIVVQVQSETLKALVADC